MLLNCWDWTAIAVFFVLLIGIALKCSKKAGKDAKDFFLSGRSMPWWLIGVSMCAASTSTNSANMFTEFIRNPFRKPGWTQWKVEHLTPPEVPPEYEGRIEDLDAPVKENDDYNPLND